MNLAAAIANQKKAEQELKEYVEQHFSIGTEIWWTDVFGEKKGTVTSHAMIGVCATFKGKGYFVPLESIIEDLASWLKEEYNVSVNAN